MYERPLRPDELMHRNHKYKDRKWVNGAWRYIYDEVSGKNVRNARSRAKINYDKAKNERHKVASKTAEEWVNEYPNNPGDAYITRANRWDDEVKRRKKDLDSANKKYNSHPSTVAKKGISAAKKQINKGKKFLSKLFG